MKKIYQIIIQDEFENLYNLGFFNDLKKATIEINKWLESYNIKLEEDLHEYISTFGYCIDKEIRVDDGLICVHGFIFDKEKLEGEINGL